MRPGYTTFQTIISAALSEERQRLAALIEAGATDDVKAALQRLLVRDESLSELAAIKQDAKYFGPHVMGRERGKRATLEPVYNAARSILPQLGISQQNIAYYASLANFYTIYDLRQLKPGQSFLYLLCYAWQRYRQLNDNLVDALRHHTKKFEDDGKANADHAFIQAQLQRQKDTPQVGKLLQLYVDDALDDVTPFGSVRDQASGLQHPAQSHPATGCPATEQQTRQPDGAALESRRRGGRTSSHATQAAGDDT